MLRVPLRTRPLHTLLILALLTSLLAPLLTPLAARADDSSLDGVTRQALADLGLPEPLSDDRELEEAWAEMEAAPETLHTLCVTQSEADGSHVFCQRRIGQPRPDLGEDKGYICSYSLTGHLFDLRQTEDGESQLISGLLELAREGWGAAGEELAAAELSKMAFEGGTIHSYTYYVLPKERQRASIWSDGHIAIWVKSEEKAYKNIINDPTSLPCTLDVFHTDPSAEDLLVAIYRAAAAADMLEGEAAPAVSDLDPTPTPPDDRLRATCELGFNRNAPLLLYVNATYDGKPLPHAQLVVAPTGDWEGARWADLVRLHDDARGSFVTGETATKTDGEGQARLAAKLLYDEAPQPILRGQPIRGAFTVRVPGLPQESDAPPLEARCHVALDYVAVGHEPAWGPLLVYRLGADAPDIAVAPDDYGTGDFPLYMGDRVVLGYDEYWEVGNDHPDAADREHGGAMPERSWQRDAVLPLTYVDGTRAEFRIKGLPDERLAVREDDVWHPARAEFMIGRALERDVVGAVTWAAFMAGAHLTEELVQQKVYAAVVSSGPVGWKAAAITWVILTTGKKSLELMLTDPDHDACRPGGLFNSSPSSYVTLREPCGQPIGFELQIRSIVELEVDATGTTVRTHAGDPSVRDASGRRQSLPPGQALHVDDAHQASKPVPFELEAPWWDSTLLAPLGETSSEGAVIWSVADAPALTLEAAPGVDVDRGSLPWIGAVCGSGLLLLGVILLLARRRLRPRADAASGTAVSAPKTHPPAQVTSRPSPTMSTGVSTDTADTWWVARRGESARGPYTWVQLYAAAQDDAFGTDHWVYDPRICQWVPIVHYHDLCRSP